MDMMANKIVTFALRQVLYAALGFAAYQYIGFSRYSAEKPPHGYFPVVLESTGAAAAALVVVPWRELDNGRPKDAAYSAVSRAEAGAFTLPEEGDFPPRVSFKQRRKSADTSEVWVDFADEDYRFQAHYDVVGGAVRPISLHTGHGMTLLVSLILGYATGRLLLWIARLLRKPRTA